MRKLIRKILSKIGNAINRIAFFTYKSPQEARVIKWFNDNGDKIHRVVYSLSSKSLVIDCGGYEGQWASDIYSRYCCRIIIFEPVIKFAENIKQSFKYNPDITVYDFGLSNVTKEEQLFISGDGSSVYKNDGESCKIKLVNATDFLRLNNIQYIDLIKINIEGGEYDLLEHLLDTNFVEHIENLQIQFHDFVENAESRMKRIQNRLEKTHYLTYHYPFVWDNWTLKN